MNITPEEWKSLRAFAEHVNCRCAHVPFIKETEKIRREFGTQRTVVLWRGGVMWVCVDKEQEA